MTVKEDFHIFYINFLKQFKGGEIIAARIQQTKAVIDGISATMKAFQKGGGWPGGIIPAALSAAYAATQVMAISKSIGEMERAQFGMDRIVDKPTMILAGEAGAESVRITPLEGPNLEGPQESGQTFNILVEGNILSEEFVEEELSEKIAEAIRRGVDFVLN